LPILTGRARPSSPRAQEVPVIKSIKFVGVPVSNQDRALEFFTSKLGFAVATDQHFDETQRWIELRIPGADTRLVLFTPKGHEDRIGGFTSISFVADDVEKTYQELSAKGVVFKAPPAKQEWGTFAMFEDPDGNTFVMGSK
jgi:catechol 2,3-dioxygenase-like lactoylglutathione lyase family enzyme